MRKTFSTTEPLNVFVELGAGHLDATASDVAEAVVEVHGPRADDFAIELRGTALAVVAPRGRFFGIGDSHDVRVLVPAGSDLTTKTGSADTATTGALGRLALKTGSGDIDFERADGAVVIESGSGDIRGREAGAD